MIVASGAERNPRAVRVPQIRAPDDGEMRDGRLRAYGGRVSQGAEVDRRPGEGVSEAQSMSSRAHLDEAMQLESEQCTGKSREISVKSSFPCSRSRCGARHVISTLKIHLGHFPLLLFSTYS